MIDGMYTPTLKEFNTIMKRLDKAYGVTKVGLAHAVDGGLEYEGIWASPANAESRRLIDSDARGGFAFVRLANMPLGWNGLTWGGLVKVRLCGASRPEARLEDQTDEILVTDKKALNEYRDKLLAQEAKKKAKKA